MSLGSLIAVSAGLHEDIDVLALRPGRVAGSPEILGADAADDLIGLRVE